MSIDNSERQLRGNLSVVKKRCKLCNNNKSLVTNEQSKCTKCGNITRFF